MNFASLEHIVQFFRKNSRYGGKSFLTQAEGAIENDRRAMEALTGKLTRQSWCRISVTEEKLARANDEGAPAVREQRIK
jgi:hypothetical protein